MARKAFLALTVCAIVTLSLTEASASAAQEATPKQRYAAAEALRIGTHGAPDASAAFGAMHALAQEGDARAQAKLAYYHLKGIGTEVDPEAAALWYQAAIEGGRDGARTSYAKLLMSQEQALASLAQLDIASDLGIERAQALRAAYHYQKRFGAQSDVAFGRKELTRFAQAGHVPSMQIALAAMRQGAEFDLNAAKLQAQLVDVARQDQAKAGGKAAEALLKLLQEERGAEALALRAEMVAHPSIRTRVRAEQALYLAYATQSHRAFRASATEIVAGTPNPDFERALFVVSRLDKNAYVHVLQEEMRARGYAVGRTTGIFNTRTLNAVVQFCADTGIQKDCRLGPMRSKVIKVIVGELSGIDRLQKMP
ncbi:SEL1-like repeat protein [Shimia sp. R11_0]|uniref:SEL1-like repeat protein n=1 Tax=Shimia sp. R11_0 TaxID=2821096 RepID=UPI001ADB5D9B|nr:SEL1-like repeat protein [Shimia sp. R11_0]MBO9478908.1 SEL1-like repeat protein [Shimia sp. R11_0]